MSDDAVRVAVRVRPLVNTEIDRGCQNIVNVISKEHQIQIKNTDKAFTFNYVFSPTVNQQQFYDNAIKGMIQNLFKGYNVTILAYGQTGSGKTHSMGTNYTPDESEGVIPRSINDIFDKIDAEKSENSFKVTASFMELYQEQLYDLLTEKNRKDSTVDIREDSKSIKIVGITEKDVKNTEEALALLVQGSENRATGATAMNHQSSRSHAIFTITIHQQPNSNPDNATTAKFHLVDLAGSERSKKTQATGERFKEGVNINKGLLALGNVISQLGAGKSDAFVSYRDSKLTRLLQDSLGGNSITLMIACVSPADYNLDETLSTLRYADRARKIKNKPIVNQDPKQAEINRLNKMITDLRLQLLGQGTTLLSCPPEHADLADQNNILKKKLAQLAEKFNANMSEVLFMNERAEVAENAREKVCDGLQAILDDFNKMMEDGSLNEKDYKICDGIRQRIIELLNEQKEMNSEIRKQLSQHSSHNGSSAAIGETNNESFAETIYLEEEHTEHTLRQAERNDQVQDINRALAVKEELINQLRNNASHIAEYHKDLQEMEGEIKKLQMEKEELLKALNSAQGNNAAKLAETRRKKVQELEKKIGELTKKSLEQNRLIKNKENSDQQIKNLSSEINQLKQARVKLVREMRKEAEKFNQYKLQRERELYKLKNQDRKRQVEIARMKIQRDNQQIVFKRKLEEAHNVNRRLKEALETQKKARQRRDKSMNSKEEIRNWLSNELTVLHSIADAECSVDRLIKDREIVAAELKKLEVENAKNSTPELQEKTKIWKEHLDLRNAQILDFQQKLVESEQETKSANRWQTIQSMNDAKSALTMLFKMSAESQKSYFNKCSDFEDLMEKYDDICTKKRQIELRQQNYEKDLLEQELAECKKKLEAYEQTAAQKVPKPKKMKTHLSVVAAMDYRFSDFEDSMNFSHNDDTEKDPDWDQELASRKTRSNTNSYGDTSKEKRTSNKRSVDDVIKCACKSKCSTRLCSCRKNGEPCGQNCSCKHELCENRDKDNVTRTYFEDITSNANVRSELQDLDDPKPKRQRIVSKDDSAKENL